MSGLAGLPLNAQAALEPEIANLAQRAAEAPVIPGTDALPSSAYDASVASAYEFYHSRWKWVSASVAAQAAAIIALIMLLRSRRNIIAARERAVAELETERATLSALIGALPDVVWVKDVTGRQVLCNSPAMARVGDYFGVECDANGEVQLSALDRKVLEERRAHTEETVQVDVVGGTSLVLETTRAPLFDSAGQLTGVLGVSRDITERKRVEEQIRLAALVYQNSSEAMMISDETGRVIAVNPAFSRITGHAAEDVIGKPQPIFQADELGAASYEELLAGLDEAGHWHGEAWQVHGSGRRYLTRLTLNIINESNAKSRRYVSLFSDITQKKEIEHQIWVQANFDALTGLPNRRMFMRQLADALDVAKERGTTLALLFVDLDHFKEVNDTLGHAAGDILLKETAHRLSACIEKGDIVARLSGDEFTVVLNENVNANRVTLVAEKLVQALAQPFHFGAKTASISGSIGAALAPSDGDDVETLLKNADLSMYAAKKQGKNRYFIFNQTLRNEAQRRAQLISDLKDALATGQFFLEYQPIVDLNSGRVSKAEALIRWNHPSRGLVPPAEFIPLAEKAGLIGDIGMWVFHEAARQCKLFRDKGHPDFRVSINVSPAQFSLNEFNRDEWISFLAEQGLPGGAVVAEITEGLLLEGSSATSKLVEFRESGIRISIDDFGTGYSALSYLQKYDVDYLKIDQSFVRGLSNDQNDRVLCEAIIAMAHKLGIKVVAEGVESEAQRDILKQAGCNFGQGYLFSRPVSASQLELMLG